VRAVAAAFVFMAAFGVVSSTRAADLMLSIAPRWRQEPLSVPSAALKNDAGQSLRVTRLAGLISGVTLRRADGAAVNLDGQFGFIDAESQRLALTLRGVPTGDYAALEFNLGLPEALNHADPAKWPAGHPLNPLVNALHWSWQGGYVFLACEGRWRTAGASDAAERGFLYHLATDARLMRLRFRADFSVGTDTTIDLALDVARLLAPQQFVADDGSEATHSAADDELAAKLALRASRAWFWLGSHDTNATDVAKLGRQSAAIAAGTSYRGATPLAFTVPAAFPQPELPGDNPLTMEGVALGRSLFSDKRLSNNGTQSCSSCHVPERAFSDAVAFSRGADGSPGQRNAMPLLNLAWSANFAWDGSQPRIRDQARAAWTNPIEMHADVARVTALLGHDAKIRSQFAAAFGTDDVTPERITLALEQFLLTQVSADAKFDRALHGGPALTDLEKRGLELFAMEFDPAHGRRGADCFHCHGGALFSDFTPKNTGLAETLGDTGRMRATGKDTDRGKFKTPSLRNVAVTAPYMHDGRFKTLEEVVAHYDHGVKRTSGLDPNLAKHPEDGMKLSAEDQRALVAFLRTLTDARFESATKPAS
jgi:cytochrome c peroxidase